jgi:hypothetical protein
MTIEFINSVFTSILSKSLLAIFLSFYLIFTHSFVFKFLINRSTIFLAAMVPISVLLITQAISQDLYLSLGLIGALSIVRYRAPVKSHYELAFIFVLVGIGVIGGVNPFYAIFLTFIISLLPFLYLVGSHYLPSMKNEDMRFNSNGRVELNISFITADKNKLNIKPKNGKLIRVDYDYASKSSSALFTFDCLDDVQKYLDKLNMKPLSVSIANN